MIHLALALVLLASPALAQQPPSPAPSPADMKALQARVLQEINANLQCSSAGIVLQQEVARLKAELEKLKPAEGK